ncbi:MAG: hypothetical protein AAGB16_08645, partial [Pseudomonadota bacterium]
EFLSILCFGLFNAAGLAALTVIAVSWMHGQTLTRQLLVRRIISGILPVWSYLVVSVVVFQIAFLFLIIPHIYLSIVLYVAQLVAAHKRVWPIAAMRQSFELNRGARWILLAISIGTFLISFAFNQAHLAALRMVFESEFERDGVLTALSFIRTIWSFIQYFISSIVLASVYVMLMRAKEGPQLAEIGDTFD